MRNSSLLSSVSGTFQPKPSRYSSQPPSRSHPRSRSGSGRSTPSIRRNVPPIHIPPSTPEDPLFSAYPDNGDTPTDSKGKLKTSLLPPTFNRNLFKRGSYVPLSRSSSSPSVKQNRWSDKMPSPTAPSYQPRRRRSSSTPPQFSDHAEEEIKFVGPSRRPFDAGGFRLGKVPSQRSSREQQSQGDSEELYIIEHSSTSYTDEAPTESMPLEAIKNSCLGFSPDDGVDGENQSSALTYLSGSSSPKRLSLHSSSIGSPARQDDQSLENYTSTSASGELFSPMSLTHTHPLSSASTSLSRSAKSGKEGKGDKEKEKGDNDSSLVAVKQQRSAQWKENQVEHRNRLQKRKHALLELVGTTVSHTDHVRSLATIYLPQAAIFPSLSDTFTRALLPRAVELLDFNEKLQNDMIKVLKEQGIGYNEGGIKRKSEGDVFETRAEKDTGDEITEMEIDLSERLDKAVKQIVKLCLDAEPGFAKYKDYCVESIGTSNLWSKISSRAEVQTFEKRCQFLNNNRHHYSLQGLLEAGDLSPIPASYQSRLQFADYLHIPVQRLGQFPLLIQRIMKTSSDTPRVSSEKLSDEEWLNQAKNLKSYVGDLYVVMKTLGDAADAARGAREKKIATDTVIDRIEPHSQVTKSFLKSLGATYLIGALDVMYQQASSVPPMAHAKVKPLAAFLFKGYLILAKVKKNKTYEVKHYLPLSLFDIVDVEAGPLSFAIRLRVVDTIFDLGTSCDAEKVHWQRGISDAREECDVSPFELPSSVSLRQARSRRASMDLEQRTPLVVTRTTSANSPTTKRHTITSMAIVEGEIEGGLSFTGHSPEHDSHPTTPARSPIRSSFSSTPDRNKPDLIFRKPSQAARDFVINGLADVFSSELSMARLSVGFKKLAIREDLKQAVVNPPILRRKMSVLDIKPSQNIAFSGEVRGSIIERRKHSQRASLPSSFLPDELLVKSPAEVRSDKGQGKEVEEKDEDRDVAPSRNASEFGSLGRERCETFVRSNSTASLTGTKKPHVKRSSSFNPLSDDGVLKFMSKKDKGKGRALTLEQHRDIEREQERDPISHPWRRQNGSKQKTTNSYNMNIANYLTMRNKSPPASVVLSPTYEQNSFGRVIEDEADDEVIVVSPVEAEPTETPTPPSVPCPIDDLTPIASRSGRHASFPEYSIPLPHNQFPPSSFGFSFFGSSHGSSHSNAVQQDRQEKQSMRSVQTLQKSLRRSMSFMSLKKPSATSLSELAEESKESESSTSSPNWRSAPTSSAPAVVAGGIAIDTTDLSGNRSSVPDTPTRRRSIRGIWSSFTPMNG